MNLRTTATKWFGFLLIFIGVGIGLSLSGVMTWGEMEAHLATMPPDAKSLTLTCPLMLSFEETGSVQAVIVNETEKEVMPVVTAGFGQPDTLDQQRITQTYILTPLETQTAQWTVDATQSAFERIIPVSILQSRYSHNPPRWGACGILLFSLFGLSGAQTLTLIVFVSLLCLATGIFLSRKFLAAKTDAVKNIKQAGGLLAALTVVTLLATLFRWWGLTIFLEALSAIALGTILVDLLILPHKSA